MNDMQFVNPTAAGIDYLNAISGTSEGDQTPLQCRLDGGFDALTVRAHGCPREGVRGAATSRQAGTAGAWGCFCLRPWPTLPLEAGGGGILLHVKSSLKTHSCGEGCYRLAAGGAK